MGEAVGMEAFINTLTTGLSGTALWGEVAPIAPFIVVLTLFGLGKRILNKNLKGAKNGTGGKV